MLRSPMLLAALADAAVPALRPIKVEGLAVPAGASYQTAHVTGHDGRIWVVRSALTGAAGAELAASDALVQLLVKRVPFDIPRAAGVARPKEGPAVAVYPQVAGHALEWSELEARSDTARAVGVALAALHGVDPRVVEEAGLPSYDAETYRHRLLADLDRAAETKRVPASLLSRWEQALEERALWRFSTTVTHGSLRGEHVMVDGTKISGVVGWEHAGVADPARDFSLLWQQAPQQAFDTVFETYAAERADRPDHHLERRIRLMGEMELAYALLQSRTMGENELVEIHTQALHSLATELDGDTSLLPPARRGTISPIAVDAVDPAEIEVIGESDLSEEDEDTVAIPLGTATDEAPPTPSASKSPAKSGKPGGSTRLDRELSETDGKNEPSSQGPHETTSQEPTPRD